MAPNSLPVGEVHEYFEIPPTALVVRTGRRKLALTLTRSSSELVHALEKVGDAPIVLLAEQTRFVERESLGGLSCYLRHDPEIRRIKRKHGCIYPFTKYGWRAIQEHLSIRWRPVPSPLLSAETFLQVAPALLAEPAGSSGRQIENSTSRDLVSVSR